MNDIWLSYGYSKDADGSPVIHNEGPGSGPRDTAQDTNAILQAALIANPASSTVPPPIVPVPAAASGGEAPKTDSWLTSVDGKQVRIRVTVKRLPGQSDQDWRQAFLDAVAAAEEEFPRL